MTTEIVGGELAIKGQGVEDARARERKLQGEVLFLEKAAADRRFTDARSYNACTAAVAMATL